jgi:hypothetical protein
MFLYAFRQHFSQLQSDKAYRDAEDNVHSGDQPFTVPYKSSGFILKCGKGCISAEEADNEEQPPLRINQQSLRKEGHKKADDKTAGNVDDKSPERKTPAPALADPDCHAIAGNGSNKPADAYDDNVHHEVIPSGNAVFLSEDDLQVNENTDETGMTNIIEKPFAGV